MISGVSIVLAGLFELPARIRRLVGVYYYVTPISRSLMFLLGVIVIFSKFSDIFGRKLIFLISTVIFIIFSAACSAAQTIVQL